MILFVIWSSPFLFDRSFGHSVWGFNRDLRPCPSAVWISFFASSGSILSLKMKT